MNAEELKKLLDQAIKEAHLVGLQSGKKETSGLVHEVLHRIEPLIKENMEPYQQESKTWRDNKDKRDDEISAVLKQILLQAQTTNGRVSKLEWWRNGIIWASGVVVAGIILILPTLRHWVSNDIKNLQQENIQKEVRNALSEALENYEFNITQ